MSPWWDATANVTLGNPSAGHKYNLWTRWEDPPHVSSHAYSYSVSILQSINPAHSEEDEEKIKQASKRCPES